MHVGIEATRVCLYDAYEQETTRTRYRRRSKGAQVSDVRSSKMFGDVPHVKRPREVEPDVSMMDP